MARHKIGASRSWWCLICRRCRASRSCRRPAPDRFARLSHVLLFFALSCLAAAALGSVVVYQRGAQNRLLAPDGTARLPPKGTVTLPPRPEATLETLQIGDAVLEGSDDYVVAGTLGYREEADAWQVHVLDAGAARRYLEV